MVVPGNYLLGIVIGVLGLLGLFLAASATSDGFYQAGLLLALFAVIFIFYLIKRAYDQAEHAEATAAQAEVESTAAALAASEGERPTGLEAPRGAPDNLKLISGIGPKLEQTLHGLGIYHFDQIAAFTPENVAWVDEHLNFKGRIEREDWINQAKNLAAGAAARS